MNTMRCQLIYVIAGLVVVACGAGRLDAQYLKQGAGNVRDANTELNSGGSNTAGINSGYNAYSFNPYGSSTGLSAGNLTVTGNITGGRSFRGFIPYSDPSQLRTSLGSSAISNFARDSVGLSGIQQAGSGQLVRPQVFYDPGRTVLSSSAIRQGMNRPGSSMPQSERMTGRTDISLQSSNLGQRPGADTAYPQRPYGPMDTSAMRTGTQEYDSADRQSQIEDMQRWSTSQDEGQMRDDGLNLKRPGLHMHDSVMKRPQDQVDTAQAQQATEQDVATRRDVRGLDIAGMDESVDNPAGTAYGTQTWQDVQTSGDLYNELRAISTMASALDKVMRGDAGGQADAEDDTGVTVSNDPSLVSRIDRMRSDNQRSRTYVREMMNKRITSFVPGTTTSTLDRVMQRAEQAMQENRYRTASRLYTDATDMQPHNGLAWLGRAHAHFAEGRYVSAAFALRRALSLFPDALRFSIDVRAMIGSDEVLREKISQIQSLLARHDDASLRLLLAYVYHFSGEADLARSNIMHALALQGNDEVLQRVADVIDRAKSQQTRDSDGDDTSSGQ